MRYMFGLELNLRLSTHLLKEVIIMILEQQILNLPFDKYFKTEYQLKESYKFEMSLYYVGIANSKLLIV